MTFTSIIRERKNPRPQARGSPAAQRKPRRQVGCRNALPIGSAIRPGTPKSRMRENSNSNSGSDRPVSGSPQTGVDRILLDAPPFVDLDSSRDWIDHGIWPAEWITVEGEPTSPCRLAFRLPFVLAGPQTSRIHVAGDERYELFLDGELIGWGSERGTVDNWHFDSYDLHLAPGPHLLAAIVSSHGIKGMRSQVKPPTFFPSCIRIRRGRPSAPAVQAGREKS